MSRNAERLLAIVCWGVLLIALWSAAAWTPVNDWNGARLYPAYLLAAGEKLYHVAGEGVVNGWIYGPVSLLLEAPLTLLPDPTWAMVMAGALNILTLLAPLALILDATITAGWPARRRLCFAAAVASVVLLLPTTRDRMVFITCDQLAIALGCGSSALLAAAVRAEGARARRLGWTAALLTTLAIWTKQTEAVLPLAQLAFLWWRRERSWVRRFAVQLVAVGAAGLLVMTPFGWDALWFNLVWVPTHHPLAAGWQSVASRALWFLLYAVPLVLAWRWAAVRQRESKESFVGAFAAQLVAVGALLVPTEIWAAAKTGGDENSFHAVYFFGLAAGLVWSGRLARTATEELGWRYGFAALALVAAAALRLEPNAPWRVRPAAHLRAALDFAAARPGQVLFPRNPLVTWATEHKQYHLEWGVFDQVIAGVSPTRKQFWSGMPPQLTYVVYPVPGQYFLMPLLPPVRSVTPAPLLTIYQVEPVTPQMRGG